MCPNILLLGVFSINLRVRPAVMRATIYATTTTRTYFSKIRIKFRRQQFELNTIERNTPQFLFSGPRKVKQFKMTTLEEVTLLFL